MTVDVNGIDGGGKRQLQWLQARVDGDGDGGGMTNATTKSWIYDLNPPHKITWKIYEKEKRYK